MYSGNETAMGDSLEISGSSAVNGVKLDGDRQCLNIVDDDYCTSVMPSGDFRVVKRMDDSGKVSDTDSGEEDEPMPLHVTAKPSFDNVREDHLKHEHSDDAKSNSEPGLSRSPSKMDENDSDDKNDDDTGENGEAVPLPITASCLFNEHETYLNLEVKNEVGDNTAKSNSDSDSSHSPTQMDHSNIINDAGTGENDEPVQPRNTASPLIDDKRSDDLILGVENDVNADGVSHDVSRDNESDPSHSVSDVRQPNAVSDSCCEHDETNSERCLVDKATGSDFCVTTNSSCMEMSNSAAGDGTVECQSNTAQDDPSTSQKSAPRATSDTETADSEAEDLPSVMTRKCGDNHHTAGFHAVVSPGLQPESDGDEAKIESSNSKSVQTDDGLTRDAADKDPERSSSVSTSQVSASDVVTSAVQSSSTGATVATSRSGLPSLNVSVLPGKVAVLSGSSSVTSSTAVTRPVQQSNKPLAASVPPTASSTGGNTRMMSKLLQDVGLLLVSQRVFKNLASVQKRKVGSSQAKCDSELLQKLKTSHQNLVAKNHGLLMRERKCWCGFRSESANVIEDHRVLCSFQGRCCYCQGEFVYRTQKMMLNHLWKAHRKVGRFSDRFASIQCGFCMQDFPSRLQSVRHMDACRQRFLLSANLAPRDNDKDIPVFAPVKRSVQLPLVVAPTQKSPAAAPQILSRNVTLSSVTLTSSGVISPVTVQLAPVPRNLGPAAPLVQIGNQLFTLLPTTTVAASSVAQTQLPVKSIGTVTPNLTVQSAQNTNTSLPVRPDIRSTNQTANQATRMPATSISVPVRQDSQQYTMCRVCNSFVKDKAALLVHMHIAHGWDGATHKICQHCCSPDATFPSLTELHLHIAKFHTSQCWICRNQFQPPDRLISHLAERHKVTMFKMLELRRCYLCASVPPLSNCTAFEEHMTQTHALQFSDTGKLWDHIRLSPDAEKNWYAKRNADGTLECPQCRGQFISANFLYRHLHVEHSGTFVKLVHCRECGKCVPSNILLIHLIAAHTRKCSVKLSEIEVSDDECIFVPPVGTKRLKNKKGERVSSGPPVKRAKAVAEAVVISDEDESDSDSDRYDDRSSDEDFVLSEPVRIPPANQLHPRVQTRRGHRNSSVDDVHEVLESIVDSGESETVSKRSVGFRNRSISRGSCRSSASAQLCNGITEDEVEIIESIVPTVCDERQRPASKPAPIKSSDRNYTVTASTADGKRSSVAVDVHAADDRSDVELNLTERQGDDCPQSPTEPKSALAESSAQQLMARDQIMVNSVEEVLEVDGETVLIVHDDDDNDNDD